MREQKERRYERVHVKPAKQVVVQGGGRHEVYPCPKMSLGGLFLQCTDPLPEGSTVRFGFSIDSEVIRGVASVRSVSDRGMGLAFRSFQRTNDRAKVDAFVKRYSQQL
jgi:hypothetical protein